MNRWLPFLFILLIFHWLTAQQRLTLVDSTTLSQASIWGNVSTNGQVLLVTTTTAVNGNPHIFLRQMDSTLQEVMAPVQLTFDSDSETNKKITDHKQLYLKGHIFITFSVRGDSDLYIFKVDENGQRVGNIVTVVEQTSNRTNDMILGTDSSRIYVGYFKPVSQHVVHQFDQGLSPIGSPVITDPALPHNNIGSMVWKDNRFYLFTGSGFGYNSNLIVTQWQADWTPASRQTSTLISSQNGDGNWFATGAVWDAAHQWWIIAFHHIKATDAIEQEHLDLAVFDDQFNLLERHHATVKARYRPSLVLWDNQLFMIFDASGNGVFMYKYRLPDVPVTTISTPSAALPQRLTVYPNYPNPFNPATVIPFFLPQRQWIRLIIYNATGQQVTMLENSVLPPGYHEIRWNGRHQNGQPVSSGTYYYQLITPNQTVTGTMQLLK